MCVPGVFPEVQGDRSPKLVNISQRVPDLEGCPGMSRLRLRVSRRAFSLGLGPGSECHGGQATAACRVHGPSLLVRAHGG